MEPSITPPTDGTTKPLSNFPKIGYNTYVWTSPLYSATAPSSTPLILLFSWNAAAAKHIAKYTISYQTLFPTSRILLIRCYTQDMLRGAASYGPLLKPALDTVYEHINSKGEVLVHSFSNGGGNQAMEFAKAWKQQYGTMLPMRAQILDSSPTKGPWMRVHGAISASLPKTLFWRLFGSSLVHLLIFSVFITDTIMWRENRSTIICKGLNDENVFDSNVPRVYLYSRADKMVGFEEVDQHANIARQKGWDVTKVQFEKSSHCGHVREDDTKYWGAILEAWKTGPRPKES